MRAYIALLRGINVGGNNKLPMKDLVSCLERLGCERVQTYIQSGNVVFQLSASAAKQIGKKLTSEIATTHSFAPAVTILMASELNAAIEQCPFVCDRGNQLHAFFLNEAPQSPDFEVLSELKTPSEEFHLAKKVFYLHAPDGLGRSKLAAKVERCLGVSSTARNWNTLLKLQAIAQEKN